jgi:radical SAM superfamily enzyme YgiQ (UPF0313 family)
MKLLLVNPYIYDFTAYDLWLKPLGLLYIASVLKKYSDCELYWLDTLDRFQDNDNESSASRTKGSKESGRGKYHREVVDKPAIFAQTPRHYARYGMSWESFQQKLADLPDVDMILVTSLMTYWIDGVNVTITALRNRFPKIKIVLGGIIPSLVSPQHLQQVMDVDLYLDGYGESKILDIVEMEGARVYQKPDFSDINTIPYPAVEFLGNQRALPLITARGCPFSCTYCASNILNKKFLERSSESILDEIFFMHDTYGTEHFAIFDDALLLNKKRRFLRVFSKIQERLNVNFHTPNGLHAREIDLETAKVFYDSGFKTLRLSFESTSDNILSRSSDKVTVQQMIKAVENLETAGFKRSDIGVYLLFGLPGQKLIQVKSALSFVKDLGVAPYLSYFSPVPGTVDFIDLQKRGIISSPVNLHETNKIYFLYNKSGFTVQQIKTIKEQASSIQASLN